MVHTCLRCFRCRPSTMLQIMGDLPAERVTPTLPFLQTGVGLCGPIFYKQFHRKPQHIKGYVAIFVYMAVKAVHIELVAHLSTNAFLAALRRFIARRALIECDYAKTFVFFVLWDIKLLPSKERMTTSVTVVPFRQTKKGHTDS